jgi:hypothetical protein
MLTRGKLPLVPHVVKDRAGVKALFKRSAEKE